MLQFSDVVDVGLGTTVVACAAPLLVMLIGQLAWSVCNNL